MYEEVKGQGGKRLANGFVGLKYGSREKIHDL
jgi:hypothetical protein